MNNRIGLFDSGLGGLSILKELMNVLPNENYLLYEDSINNPYGEKDEDTLFEITSNIVDYLLKQDCKLIVIACNTATTSCMDRLKEKYKDVIFVGTVPAIKVACQNHFSNIINLSTTYTQKSERVIELIHDYQLEGSTIYNISGENLAFLIENDKKEEIRMLLDKLLTPYKDIADALVLGCTHYSLIKEEIAKVLPNTTLLDGCNGVAREVKRQLELNNLVNNNSNKGKVEILNTKDDKLVERSFEILKIERS